MSDSFLAHVSKTNVGNKRTANEDSFGVADTPNGKVFVVCDGMGGHVGGATASKLAVDCIIEFLSGEPFNNIFIGLNNAIQYANNEIHKRAKNNPELKGMGTTCTLLIAREPEIFIAHVGDSRIYIHSNNKLYRITKDHSYVQELVDQGIISDDEMETHPKKNQILKALGISENIEPTVYSAPIHSVKGDKFLLCSDGLNGEINDANIELLINKHQSIENASDDLIDAALKAGGNDNITLQLIEVLESPFEKSDFPDYNPSKNLTDKVTDPDLGQTIIDLKRNKSSKGKIIIAFTAALVCVTLGLYLLNKNEIISIDFNNNSNNQKDSTYEFNKVVRSDSNELFSEIPLDSILKKDTIQNSSKKNYKSKTIIKKEDIDITDTLKIDSNSIISVTIDSNSKNNISLIDTSDKNKKEDSVTINSVTTDSSKKEKTVTKKDSTP